MSLSQYKSLAIFILLAVVVLFISFKLSFTPEIEEDSTNITYKEELFSILDRLEIVSFDVEFVNQLDTSRYTAYSPTKLPNLSYPGRVNPFTLNSSEITQQFTFDSPTDLIGDQSGQETKPSATDPKGTQSQTLEEFLNSDN